MLSPDIGCTSWINVDFDTSSLEYNCKVCKTKLVKKGIRKFQNALYEKPVKGDVIW